MKLNPLKALGSLLGSVLSGPILGPLGELAKLFMERNVAIAKGKIMVAETEAKAKAMTIIKKAESDASWEQTQAEASKGSWKDEYWTLVLSFPLFLIWPEATREWVLEGFLALETVPEWYLYFLGVAVLTSFGIKPTAQYFLSKKAGK